MGLKIADLLKYKSSTELVDQEGNTILDGDKPIVVYLRLIGDQDLEESYTAARLESARLRSSLRDKNSVEYKDRVEPIGEATKEQALEIIESSRTSNLEAEARANVERPDLPKIEEFAVDADAPSLEEQERLDKAISDIDTEYKKALEEHVKISKAAIMTEFEDKPLKELLEMAQEDVANVLALSAFYDELMAQKLTRGAYSDKTYREKAFEDVRDFKDSHPIIKEQLINKYLALEIDPEKLKN